MSTEKKSIVLAMLVLTTAGLGAQGTATLVRQRQVVNLAEPWRPTSVSAETKIVGQVLDIQRVPVANARVQLRNLITGTIQREGSADDNGEYQFTVDDPGTYVVEMLRLDGQVVALSNAGTLARYDTLQTVVQLPGRWEGTRGMVMPAYISTFLGMSAATTMTAETVRIALGQRVRPVDSGEPVSPYKP